MPSADVRVLQEFKDNARTAGCSTASLLAIVTRIADRPMDGINLVPLFDELGVLPMGGFYVQSFRFDAKGRMTEGHSLHLRLSNHFPVLLCDFAATAIDQLPWLASNDKARIRAYGRKVYDTLTSAIAR